MTKKFLIAGHGLAGCVLALSFYRRNIPFRVAGKSLEGEASAASSGLITPVTGRKYVKSWMIDELIASALDFYSWTEVLLGKKYFRPVEIIRFLSHPEAMIAWQARLNDPEYAAYISSGRYEALDMLDRPYGILTGGYKLDAKEWLTDVHSFLSRENLLTEDFIPIDMKTGADEVVIYATGAIGGQHISKGLIPNKGEALIVRMPEWKYPAIIKEDIFFIPLEEGEDLFWVGSFYQPWPDDVKPGKEGKHLLIGAIEKVYDGAFTIMEHLAGVRPTIDDRRPLVGLSPDYPGKYLFNGMGTKGTSLTPYWADQLIRHLIDHQPINKLVDPVRYKKQPYG